MLTTPCFFWISGRRCSLSNDPKKTDDKKVRRKGNPPKMTKDGKKKHGTIHPSLGPGNPLPQPRMTAWKMDFKVVPDFLLPGKK